MPLASDGILMGRSRTFKTVNYEQALELTVRLGDCLPPDHLARFVVDSVAQLDLSALSANMEHAVGNPTLPKCCWACCSMGMRPGYSVRARLSEPPMRRCPVASSQAICIPITIRWPRIARTFLPDLKHLFVQVLLLAQEAGGLKVGTISLDGTKVHADASKRKAVRDIRRLEVEAQLRTEVEELFAPARTKRPARGTRWVGGARRDRTARGPPGAAGRGQSAAGSACRRACGSRAG